MFNTFHSSNNEISCQNILEESSLDDLLIVFSPFKSVAGAIYCPCSWMLLLLLLSSLFLSFFPFWFILLRFKHISNWNEWGMLLLFRICFSSTKPKSNWTKYVAVWWAMSMGRCDIKMHLSVEKSDFIDPEYSKDKEKSCFVALICMLMQALFRFNFFWTFRLHTIGLLKMKSSNTWPIQIASQITWIECN